MTSVIGKGSKDTMCLNSELGLYMDHMKGNRKTKGTSVKNDLRQNPNVKVNVQDIEYWKKVPPA